MTKSKLKKQGEYGLKDKDGKIMMELVMPNFILGIGEVLTFGAKKYKPNSWQRIEFGLDNAYAALMRHVLAWRAGEKFDKESGLSHLKHVACNTMFLLDHEENNRK